MRKQKAKTSRKGIFVDSVTLPIDTANDKHVIVIDIGSESTRVDAYNQNLFRCYHMVFPNKGLIVKDKKQFHLNKKKFRELREFIESHVEAIRAHYPADAEIPLRMIATEIVRQLPEAQQLKLQKIARRMGVELDILSGKQEIQYYAEAIRLFWPNAFGRVLHVGHGSLDIAEMGKDGVIVESYTFPHGMHSPAPKLDDIFTEVRAMKSSGIYLCGKVMREMTKEVFGVDAAMNIKGGEKGHFFNPTQFEESIPLRTMFNGKHKAGFSYPIKIVRHLLSHDVSAKHCITVSRGMREAIAAQLFRDHLGISPNPLNIFIPQVQTPIADAHEELALK